MIRVAATLVLITALTAVGVHFGYQQIEQKLLNRSCLPALPKSSRSETATTISNEIAAVQNFQIIVSRDIFQSAVKTEKEQEIAPPTPPPPMPTALNLILAGTVVGTEQTARAIIINNVGKDRKQQLLQIGDEVPGTGAVIKEIFWDKIQLDVNGKREILETPKPKNGRASAGLNSPLPNMPQEPEMGMDESINDERPSAARPNRRISLPVDAPTLEEPIEMTGQMPTPAEPVPVDQPTPLPTEESLPMDEPTPAELPPLN